MRHVVSFWANQANKRITHAVHRGIGDCQTRLISLSQSTACHIRLRDETGNKLASPALMLKWVKFQKLDFFKSCMRYLLTLIGRK